MGRISARNAPERVIEEEFLERLGEKFHVKRDTEGT
jgi:hypothetical protein